LRGAVIVASPEEVKRVTKGNEDAQGPLIYLDEILPYFEQSFSLKGEPQIFLSGRLLNEGVTTKDIDIFVESRHQNPRIEEAVKNLFLKPLPFLPSRPDLAERVNVVFTLEGPISGYWIKTHSSRFFAQTYSFDWPREVDILEGKKEVKEQYVGEKVPTEVCPHCREISCSLLNRYEPLSDEYLEWLKDHPATTPLRFPIECSFAVEFRCPYPKYYFYSDEPLSLEYVVEEVPEVLMTPEVEETFEDKKLSRELKKEKLKLYKKLSRGE